MCRGTAEQSSIPSPGNLDLAANLGLARNPGLARGQLGCNRRLASNSYRRPPTIVIHRQTDIHSTRQWQNRTRARRQMARHTTQAAVATRRQPKPAPSRRPSAPGEVGPPPPPAVPVPGLTGDRHRPGGPAKVAGLDGGRHGQRAARGPGRAPRASTKDQGLPQAGRGPEEGGVEGAAQVYTAICHGHAAMPLPCPCHRS